MKKLLSVVVSVTLLTAPSCKKTSSMQQQQTLDCDTYNYTVVQVFFGDSTIPHSVSFQENEFGNVGPMHMKNIPAGVSQDTIHLTPQTQSDPSAWGYSIFTSDSSHGTSGYIDHCYRCATEQLFFGY